MSQIEHLQFGHLDHLADQFEEILKKYSITIKVHSPLENSLLLLHKIKLLFSCPLDDSQWPSFASDLQDALGAIHLIQLVIRNSASPEFYKIVPHLHILSNGETVLTKAACAWDEASNKIYELFVSLAVLQCGKNISVDEPIHSSKGKNPDVLANMSDGLLWGIACKAVGGDAPESLFQLLENGVAQIEISPAQTGIVMISFKNRYPHDRMLRSWPSEENRMPDLSVFPSICAAKRLMINWTDTRLNDMVLKIGNKAVMNMFRNKKALPGMLIPLLEVIFVNTESGPSPCILGFLYIYPLEYALHNKKSRFNMQTQKVLTEINKGFSTASLSSYDKPVPAQE